MTDDPVGTNPEQYSVIFENDRVRVLRYHDVPGIKTEPHDHPDSVMITLSAFDRRLYAGDGTRDVSLESGRAMWLDAQRHSGHNTGDTDTHVVFVELKEPAPRGDASEARLGPVAD